MTDRAAHTRMEYRTLGRTGLRVSLLGYGTAPLGDVYGVADPPELTRAVHLAIEKGINFFDSSPYYGMTLSESRLGEALLGRREKTVLATKVGRYGKDQFDFSAARITASVDESLRRLKTDYVDLLQAHDVEFGDFRQIVEETIPALRRIQQSGKARFIGITGYPPNFLLKIAQRADVDTILSYCHYNLLNTRMDEGLTAFARERSIGLINASPLHMGVLSERGAPAWHPAPAEVHAAAQRAMQICARRGVLLSAHAIRFCLDHPYVATTLVGMGSQAEVMANLAILDLQSDAELLAEIRAELEPVFNVEWPSGRPENND